MMARKFSELRARMRPEARVVAQERAIEMLMATPLSELRRAMEMTQEEIAAVLGTTQANVSQMERRPDMYLSTLRQYVEALGGELEITARFPGSEPRLLRLSDSEEVEEKQTAARR
jgi:transcriptional regulator with XRE-family HTH domain